MNAWSFASVHLNANSTFSQTETYFYHHMTNEMLENHGKKWPLAETWGNIITNFFLIDYFLDVRKLYSINYFYICKLYVQLFKDY